MVSSNTWICSDLNFCVVPDCRCGVTSSFFWNVTHRRLVFNYGRFGTTYQSHVRRSSRIACLETSISSIYAVSHPRKAKNSILICWCRSQMLKSSTTLQNHPSGGETFRTRPDRPWGPPSLLYSGYRVCFPIVKQLGHGVNRPLPSRAEVKETVELYLYSPSGPSWPVLRRTLPFSFRNH
jgi:hypothetical protein